MYKTAKLVPKLGLGNEKRVNLGNGVSLPACPKGIYSMD